MKTPLRPSSRSRKKVLTKSSSLPTGSLPMERGGVLQRPPFLKTLSTVKSLPKWKFGEKRPSGFILYNENPAPGSYNLPEPSRTGKFREKAGASFGGGANRFGFDPNPNKVQPAPGQYGIPKNVLHELARKPGFSMAARGNPCVVRAADPGPGAYEMRKQNKGKAFTALGKLPPHYKQDAAMPGPGAYDPRNGCLSHEPNAIKVGFCTNTRLSIADAHLARSPGPGAYEHDLYQKLGSGQNKFSMSGRPRGVNNFSSYVAPGPGTYDGDATCFGY